MARSTTVGFILFFILYQLSAQDINQSDDAGRKQGKWSKSFSNGNIRYEGQFRDDRPYGIFIYFYESSEKKAETRFSDNGIIARTTTYYQNGAKMTEGKYINQKKDSTWNYYSENDGTLIAKERYTKNELEGTSTTFYPENGQTLESIEFKNGLQDGAYLKYFPEGELMTESFYKNGQLDGKFTSYYQDGSIQITGTYTDGLQTGNWEYFSEDGKPITEEQFKEQDVLGNIGE